MDWHAVEGGFHDHQVKISISPICQNRILGYVTVPQIHHIIFSSCCPNLIKIRFIFYFTMLCSAIHKTLLTLKSQFSSILDQHFFQFRQAFLSWNLWCWCSQQTQCYTHHFFRVVAKPPPVWTLPSDGSPRIHLLNPGRCIQLVFLCLPCQAMLNLPPKSWGSY